MWLEAQYRSTDSAAHLEEDFDLSSLAVGKGSHVPPNQCNGKVKGAIVSSSSSQGVPFLTLSLNVVAADVRVQFQGFGEEALPTLLGICDFAALRPEIEFEGHEKFVVKLVVLTDHPSTRHVLRKSSTEAVSYDDYP
ncbi:hypothetical protein SUGI_0261650 [Cryptomeria japonica]|nr:hypothetical protein SUGI_0261650 [Cryptomeria japonica]